MLVCKVALVCVHSSPSFPVLHFVNRVKIYVNVKMSKTFVKIRCLLQFYYKTGTNAFTGNEALSDALERKCLYRLCPEKFNLKNLVN